MTGPGWLEAERHGTYSEGPGSGWDPLAERELDEAVRLGDLAERMTRVAHRLQCAVRNRDRATIARIIHGQVPVRIPEEIAALLVCLAAMGCEDRPAEQVLGWVDFDEHGRALPGPGPVAEVVPLGRRAGDGGRHAAA